MTRMNSLNTQTASLDQPSAGSAWAWGANNYYQLGDGTAANRDKPQKVGTTSDWKTLSSKSYHTQAVRTDGTLWAWGYNDYGGLGDGTTTSRATPVQIGTDKDWAIVAAHHYHSLALKSDGSLWAAGYNGEGQLGDGTNVQKNSFVRIGSDRWLTIDAGERCSIGIKADGSLWTWGQNDYGQLGDGTITNRNQPVRVGRDTDWLDVSIGQWNTAALKQDGSLWVWGANNVGQIGDGTTGPTARPAPVRIGSDRWKAVAVGSTYHILAVRADGTLWSWGQALYGKLGHGPKATNVTSPVQVGKDSNWAAVAASYFTSLGLKPDGTLWGWGYNAYDEVAGDGTATADTQIFEPKRIGTETGWFLASAGAYHSAGLRTSGRWVND